MGPLEHAYGGMVFILEDDDMYFSTPSTHYSPTLSLHNRTPPGLGIGYAHGEWGLPPGAVSSIGCFIKMATPSRYSPRFDSDELTYRKQVTHLFEVPLDYSSRERVDAWIPDDLTQKMFLPPCILDPTGKYNLYTKNPDLTHLVAAEITCVSYGMSGYTGCLLVTPTPCPTGDYAEAPFIVGSGGNGIFALFPGGESSSQRVAYTNIIKSPGFKTWVCALEDSHAGDQGTWKDILERYPEFKQIDYRVPSFDAKKFGIQVERIDGKHLSEGLPKDPKTKKISDLTIYVLLQITILYPIRKKHSSPESSSQK